MAVRIISVLFTVIAASSMDEIREAAELFEIRIKEDDMKRLDAQYKDVKNETLSYYTDIRSGSYGGVFAQDMAKLVATVEFVDFYAYLQIFYVRAAYDEYNSAEMHAFMQKWRSQYVKTKMAQAKVYNNIN